MKKYTLLLTIFLLLVIKVQETYAQKEWEQVVDSIEITEARVVDSSIITMLDSAFTFLRSPPLDFGPYYYTLVIEKDTVPIIRTYSKVNLYVEDFFSGLDLFGLELFHEHDKMLFNYKGLQILIKYYAKNNDTFALQYFKPTTKKNNFYFYFERDKSNKNNLFIPEMKYSQHVFFFIGKDPPIFFEYWLNKSERFTSM